MDGGRRPRLYWNLAQQRASPANGPLPRFITTGRSADASSPHAPRHAAWMPVRLRARYGHLTMSVPDVPRIAVVRRLPVSLTLDGAPVETETTIVDAGSWTVCLATTIADPRAPIELHSAYTGTRGAATRAVHLRCGPRGGEAETVAVEHAADALPVWHAHDRLLLDHLQVVVDCATRLRLAVAVGELDDALASLIV